MIGSALVISLMFLNPSYCLKICDTSLIVASGGRPSTKSVTPLPVTPTVPGIVTVCVDPANPCGPAALGAMLELPLPPQNGSSPADIVISPDPSNGGGVPPGPPAATAATEEAKFCVSVDDDDDEDEDEDEDTAAEVDEGPWDDG